MAQSEDSHLKFVSCNLTQLEIVLQNFWTKHSKNDISNLVLDCESHEARVSYSSDLAQHPTIAEVPKLLAPELSAGNPLILRVLSAFIKDLQIGETASRRTNDARDLYMLN